MTILVVLALGTDRIPFAQVGVGLTAIVLMVSLLAAGLPVSTADRYRRRARELVFSNPEQSIQDMNRAIDLDPHNRSFLLERARVLRLLSKHKQAAQDLRTYLEQSRGEPRARVG